MFFARGRSAPPTLPTRATHGRCVLCHLCRELWRGCAQVCTVVFRVCTVCARVSVSVVHGVHSVRNVLSPDGGFQRVFCVVCAHLQNVSDSVAELDAPREQVDGSEICARVRKKQLRTGFQPGEQKRNRRQIRELFPSGAVRGRIWPDLAKSGAPAAILINAYSGDFCHPVLSNALAQEPLVYHSGTRELFSGHFRTFSEISTFSTFWHFLLKFANSVENKKKENSQMRTHLKIIFTNAQNSKKLFHVTKTFPNMCRTQIRKSANVQKPSVHKMRKSAAHTFLQMQLSAQCTILQMHISQICTCRKFTNANATFCTVHKNISACNL